jgi:prepilin-type processing-associated H-X9-DG protein
VNASKFVAPSQLIVMAPAMVQGPDVNFTGTSDTNPELQLPAGTEKMGTHSGRSQINALFADTHVENMIYKRYANTKDEEGLKQWYPEGKESESKTP